ncbi:MAG: PAS domain S-box protein [Anaerolineales bacterium]|nr:PAS domain S-box protein [Anaerolineales bacterium]
MVSKDQIKVLLIEDDDDDYILTRDYLNEIKTTSYNLDWVATYAAGLEKLGTDQHDVCLVDYRLGELDGLDLLGEAISRGCQIPIIILTGQGDHEVDVAAMSAGAADYLVKGQFSTHELERSMRYAIERKRAENTLLISEEQFSKAFHSGPLLMTISKIEDGTYLEVNENFACVTGYSREESIGTTSVDLGFIAKEDREKLKQTLLSEGKVDGMELALQKKSGETFYCLYFGEVITVAGKQRLLSIAEDITERKLGEEELRLLFELTRVVSEAPDFHSAIEFVLRRVGEVAKWDYGEAWTPGDDGSALECVPVWYSSNPEKVQKFRQISEEIKFQPNVGLPGRVWASRQPEWIPDITATQEDVYLRAREATETGLKTAFGVPLIVGEEVIAVLVYYISEARQEDNQVIELVSSVTAQLEEVMRRKLAENALQENEERYRTVANFTHDWEYWIDPDGNYKYISPACERITGYQPEEFDNSPELLGSLIHPEDQAHIHQHFGEEFGVDEAVSFEFRIVTRDGETRWIEHICRPVFSSDGEFLGRRGSNRDITKRALAQQAVRQAEEKYRNIFENSLEGIFQSTPEGRFITVNPALAGILGYASPDDLITSINDITHQIYVDPKQCEEFRRLMDEQGEISTFEFQVYRKDGSVTWVSENARAVLDTHGALLYYEGNIEDISRRKQAEERIRRQLQHLEALRKIDQAISGSVDLRITLDVLLDQVITRLAVDAANVLLCNASIQTLEYFAGRGFRTEALKHTSLRLGESHAGQAALKRRIVHIPDFQNSETGFLRSPLLQQEKFVVYFGVPLVAKGAIKGVLEIFHRTPFAPDKDWMDFLETLAGQAAIAIDNATLFMDLQRSNTEITIAYDTTLEGWSRALEMRDMETDGHSQRVTEMTMQLAQAMGMSKKELAHVRRGALLHDIGKMGVPDSILHKPGPLTDKEWEIMRQHPVYAYNFLSSIGYLRPALDIPYYHHEKWDGTGYPFGLDGEKIPSPARIFAVVDVWDALSSERPYRDAWPKEEIITHIQEQAGKHFDPRVVEAFLDLLSDNISG